LVPAPLKSDWTDPRNYKDWGLYGFQFAARYGRNQNIPESFRKSHTPEFFFQHKDSAVWGLGYVKYLSGGNENDKDWIGSQRWLHQKGAEEAAMMSAFYDGHKGALGPGIGVKNADPTMIVLPPGMVTTRNDNYLRSFRDWVIKNRGYRADGVTPDWPFDEVDIHNYSGNGTGQFNSTLGAAHEQSTSFGDIDTVLTFLGKYANSMKVVNTETGWETRDTTIGGVFVGTPQNAIPIGSKTVQNTQADWIARMALLNWGRGIEATDFYEGFDQLDVNTDNGLFGSSGLSWSENQGIYSGTPGVVKSKHSLNFLVQLRKLLDNYKVDSLFKTGNLWKIQSSYKDTLKYIYWMGTQTGATQSVTIPVSSGKKYTLNYTTENPTATTFSTGAGYTFTATETPTIILVGQMDTTATNIPPTANAGSDQTITLPTATVTLTGSGSDVDGSITSVLWTQISGAPAIIVSPGSNSTSITGLVAGTYVFRFTVTDNNGDTGFDLVQVTVNAPAYERTFTNQIRLIFKSAGQFIKYKRKTLL
jgi:endoglucanase